MSEMVRMRKGNEEVDVRQERVPWFVQAGWVVASVAATVPGETPERPDPKRGDKTKIRKGVKK